jgi:hypothetical protein
MQGFVVFEYVQDLHRAIVNCQLPIAELSAGTWAVRIAQRRKGAREMQGS